MVSCLKKQGLIQQGYLNLQNLQSKYLSEILTKVLTQMCNFSAVVNEHVSNPHAHEKQAQRCLVLQNVPWEAGFPEPVKPQAHEKQAQRCVVLQNVHWEAGLPEPAHLSMQELICHNTKPRPLMTRNLQFHVAQKQIMQTRMLHK